MFNQDFNVVISPAVNIRLYIITSPMSAEIFDVPYSSEHKKQSPAPVDAAAPAVDVAESSKAYTEDPVEY